MASTNQSPQYKEAELKFLNAKSNEEKLVYLEEMIRECPKHKSSEKMLANLKTRYIKLKEKIESQKKTSKSAKKQGIKKEDIQIVIVGKTRSGKSTLLSLLTNAAPKISESEFEKFTTKKPVIGIMNYQGIDFQIIENPAIGSEYYNKGLSNSADIIIILFNNFSDLDFIEKELSNVKGKKLYVFNSINENDDLRKIESKLQSRRYNFVIINLSSLGVGDEQFHDVLHKQGGLRVGGEGDELNELKEKLLENSGKIRIYTKQPGKEKSEKPVVLEMDSTARDLAEKILHGFSEKVKETKIWGPSSKFPGQKVGLNHILKDLDIVEFKTK